MNKNLCKFEAYSRLRHNIIFHPGFQSAFRQLIDAYERMRLVGVGTNILLVGQSGTGKTTLKNRFLTEYPPVTKRDRIIRPILAIDTPALPTVKNVAEAMLVELGDPAFARGSAIDKTSRILRYLEISEVRMLILDETQHFIDQGNVRTPREVSDWLKSLIDKARISAVLIGLPRTAELLDVNEQLRRRFNERIVLEPFNLSDAKSLSGFISFLIEADKLIALPERCEFRDKDLLKRIHFATNGIVDYVIKLFLGAYEIALQKGLNSLSPICFEESFATRIWPGADRERNPFHSKFRFDERLDKPGMPFHKISNFSLERRPHAKAS